MRTMRPPKLWEGVDEDVRTVKKGHEVEKRASRIDQPPTPAASSSSPAGFKRTMSTVVNSDAKRIAALRPTRPIPSNLQKSFKPAPMTSPARASTARITEPSKPAVRNAKWNSNTGGGVAASSPGGWVEPMDPPPPPSDNFNPMPPTPKRQSKVVQESPNTAIRRIMGTSSTLSLALPLSDDATVVPDSSTFDWNADLSSFFDVEGFSMSTAEMTGIAPSERTEGDDDVMSQLFRTSSAMMESSPPFDFSQLPPSSPPVALSDLPHSALLLSSPDLSPMNRLISPAKSTGKTYTPFSVPSSRPTPALSNPAPTPYDPPSAKVSEQSQEEDKELRAFLAAHQFDSAALEELWRMSNSPGNGNGNVSSTTETEGMMGIGGNVGDGDLYAILEKSFARA